MGGPPDKGGTYILVLKLESPLLLKIGKLGTYQLPQGYYLYVGSALNNLNARLRRHFRTEKRFHWHIDYLLKSARVEEVLYARSQNRLECLWNKAISRLPGASYPIPGFGSSDCRCYSHLTNMDNINLLDKLKITLKESNRLVKITLI